MVTLARFSARVLCDPAVDHAMPNLLFAVVVRWRDTLGKHEAKIVLRQVIRLRLRRFLGRVLHDRESRSKILDPFRPRRLPNQFQKAVAVRNHRAMKTLCRHLVAAVPGRKQLPRAIQKLLGPSLCFLVRMLSLESNVTYQVSPVILGLEPKVPGERAVGREIIEVQIA